MPTVPLYSNQPVQDIGIRAPQIDNNARNIGFDPSAFKAATDLGDTVSKIADEAKQRADQVVNLGADRDLAAAETQILHDPKTGALFQKDENAFALPEQVKATWDKKVEEISGRLQNESQRFSFQKSVAARWEGIDKTVQAHVGSQIQSVDNKTFESFITNEQDAAVLAADPKTFDGERIQVSLDRQLDALDKKAKRDGMPEEVYQETYDKITTKTHALVIEKLLANDADIAAKQYYNENKDEITSGPARIQLDKALEEGTLRGESQRKSDSIIQKYTSEVDQLEAARKITDPKVRDETERRVLAHQSNLKAAEKNESDDLYMKAANLVDKNPGKLLSDVVDPVSLSKLSLEHREALERRLSNLPNDNKKWLDFIYLDRDQLASLSRADFESQWWVHFDREHRSQAEQRIKQAIDEKEKGAQNPNLTNAFSFRDQIESSLKDNKLIPQGKPVNQLKNNDYDLLVKFQDEASHQLEDFELNHLGGKRKANYGERQKILDDLVKSKVFVDKNYFFSDPAKPAFLVKEDEKGKSYVPYKELTTEDVNQLTNIIQRKGRPVTKDKLQRAAAAVKLKDRKLFEQIIGE